MKRVKQFTLIALIIGLSVIGLHAEEAVQTSVSTIKPINVVWTLIAAFLVFFMQAGFAMVEVGFTRAKNAET